jgi:osmotically-inducible protein OsmY
MNKIFFGIHTSLLLLLCALLACCSQDEEEYAPTEKLVPLDISAVIEGDTRVSLNENGAGSFGDGDEITITIDGDESGTEYKYKYDVEKMKWIASDSKKQIMIKESADPITIKATYGSVNLSGINSPLSLDALANSLVATEESISYDTRNVTLRFTHTACKLVINVTDIPEQMTINYPLEYHIYVIDRSIWEEHPPFYGYGEAACSFQVIVYVPTSAEYIDCFIGEPVTTNVPYRINLSNLQAGKTYTCYVRYNYIMG